MSGFPSFCLCASLFFVYSSERSKGGRAEPFEVFFEAEKFQCVDFVLSEWVER